MSRVIKLFKNAVNNIVIIFLSLTLIFIIGEMTLRLYHYYKYRISILNDANHGLLSKDDKLGWKMSNNLKVKVKDQLNNAQYINIETNEYGFRLFGDPQSNKIKLFFIGDSFTAAMDISNDKTYYGIIKNLIKDVEVFAYGAGGFGSLQEFMILDEFIDLIKPDIIIWQFYENDFTDNSNELDMLKSFYNTGTPRPYLDLNGGITYRYAQYDNLFWVLPTQVAENLRLLKFLNTRVSLLINRLSKSGTVSQEIAHGVFNHSTKITEMIMGMVTRRAGNIPVYLFCITDKQPYYDTIKNICQSLDIRFIDGVNHSLSKYEKEKPMITKAADREHLNELGHWIISESIIKFLKENGVIQ